MFTEDQLQKNCCASNCTNKFKFELKFEFKFKFRFKFELSPHLWKESKITC